MKKDNISEIIIDGCLLFVVSTVLVVCADKLFSRLKENAPKDNPLISAIAQDDTELFSKELQKCEASDKDNPIIAKDEHGHSALIRAAYSNLEDPTKRSACDTKRKEISTLLLNAGADLNATDKDQWNALSWAAWSGLPQTAELLIQKGISINQADRQGNTPLMLAAKLGHADIVELLLKNGADPSLQNLKGHNAATLATIGRSQYRNIPDSFQKILALLEQK